MQVVIEIPEEIYKASQIIDVKYEDVIQIPLEVIANGTPLDEIRAEIDSHCSDNRDRNDGLYIAMKIIDKYRAESEG